MTGDGAIASFLGGARRRATRRAALRAAARATLVALLALLAGLAAARVLGPGLGARTAAIAALLVGGAWVGWRLRADAAGRDDDALARRVGAIAPELGGDLLSVVQLRREPAPLFSPALLAALSEHTSRGLPHTAAEVVPQRELRRPALLAFLGALCVVAVGWNGRSTLAMVAGLVEPPPERISEPLLGDLTVEYRYPAHTGRPPRTVSGSDGGLLAPRGTHVVLRGRARQPLAQAEIVLGSDPREAHVVGRMVTARLVVDRPGEYRVRARLRGGRRVVEALGHPIVVEPDDPPRVELLAPADSLEVDGQTSVPLAFSAQDDFGLLAVDLVWRAGEGAAKRIPLGELTPGAQRLDGKTRLDLDAADLRAPVTYWVEARDNDSVSGPKTSRSRMLTVRMRGDGDRRENALAAQQEALERAVLHLADRLETGPGEPAEPLLHPRLGDLIFVLAGARKASARDRFAPPDLDAVLEAIVGRLEQLHRVERKGSAPALTRRLVAELERDVLDLDRLIAGQRVEELMALAARIRRDHERLSERLAQLQEGDETARQEIEREMAEMEERIRDLMARAGELARELPSEYLSPGAVPDQDMMAELAEAREKLERGDLEGARAALDRLGQAIDRAMAELGSGEGGQRYAERQRALAEALEEVAGLASEQRRIADEAGAVERQAMAGRREDLDRLVNDLRARTERLQEILEQADAAELGEPDATALDAAREGAGALAESLESTDFGTALEHAKGVRERLDGRADPLAEPGRIAAGIAADLEDALREPPVDGTGRGQLGQLAQRQQAAQGRAGALAERLGGMSRDAPALGESGPALREAAGAMQRGAGAMRQGRSRAGHQAADDAADRLASLEQQMREQQRSSQAGGRGMDREPVKVPGAEAYRVPKEWREEILEAMKEGAPEGYRDLVRRYYEDLVR